MKEAEDGRLKALSYWLKVSLGLPVKALEPISNDASFRRYFRVAIGEASFVAMDAPPAQEDVRPFIKIAHLLHRASVHVPQIYHRDLEQGFLLLSDLGTANYLSRLNEKTVDALYADAMEILVTLQKNVALEDCPLPPYGPSLLRRELDLFRDWFLRRLLMMDMGESAASLLEKVWALLMTCALEQPKVCVHRDYHSRNLMVTEWRNPGVLDFQDAVVGPLTYDLVSLLRDCYIAWPSDRIERWVNDYYRRLSAAGLVANGRCEEFWRWFDWMGVQRHLKAIGIFSRLKLRDGKGNYLAAIPRTLGYVTEVCRKYPQLNDFLKFLEDEVDPRISSVFKALP